MEGQGRIGTMEVTEVTERVQGDEKDIPLRVEKNCRSSGVWVSSQGFLLDHMLGSTEWSNVLDALHSDG